MKYKSIEKGDVFTGLESYELVMHVGCHIRFQNENFRHRVFREFKCNVSKDGDLYPVSLVLENTVPDYSPEYPRNYKMTVKKLWKKNY